MTKDIKLVCEWIDIHIDDMMPRISFNYLINPKIVFDTNFDTNTTSYEKIELYANTYYVILSNVILRCVFPVYARDCEFFTLTQELEVSCDDVQIKRLEK